MAEVITHISIKKGDSFSEVPVPIGSSAQYIETTFVNPETQESQVSNLQQLINDGSLGGNIYWKDVF